MSANEGGGIALFNADPHRHRSYLSERVEGTQKKRKQLAEKKRQREVGRSILARRSKTHQEHALQIGKHKDACTHTFVPICMHARKTYMHKLIHVLVDMYTYSNMQHACMDSYHHVCTYSCVRAYAYLCPQPSKRGTQL